MILNLIVMLGTLSGRCEPFDTYPRTYDLLHAAGLFSIEQKRLNFFPLFVSLYLSTLNRGK